MPILEGKYEKLVQLCTVGRKARLVGQAFCTIGKKVRPAGRVFADMSGKMRLAERVSFEIFRKRFQLAGYF